MKLEDKLFNESDHSSVRKKAGNKRVVHYNGSCAYFWIIHHNYDNNIFQCFLNIYWQELTNKLYIIKSIFG